jgi:hypothetical protein
MSYLIEHCRDNQHNHVGRVYPLGMKDLSVTDVLTSMCRVALYRKRSVPLFGKEGLGEICR